jgi:hypothetical protein
VAVNEEIKDLFAAGADIVQVDEPYMQARPQKAEDYGLAALNRALDGVTGTTVSISASAIQQSFTSAPVATRFSPSSRTARAARSRSKPPSPSSTAQYSPNLAAKKSCSASSICLT